MDLGRPRAKIKIQTFRAPSIVKAFNDLSRSLEGSSYLKRLIRTLSRLLTSTTVTSEQMKVMD